MRKLVLFMHTSLDNFVAGPNGEMDWIHVDEVIFDFVGERTNQTDTALYGRVTYDMMESYWPTAGEQPEATKHDIEHSRWYGNVQKIVLSRSMKGQDLPNTKIISEDLSAEILKLKQQEGKDILIFGSPRAAHALMQEQLIDEFWLFVNPVILGKGIPLFKGIQQALHLNLVKATPFVSGVICLHYKRKQGI